MWIDTEMTDSDIRDSTAEYCLPCFTENDIITHNTQLLLTIIDIENPTDEVATEVELTRH